MVVLEGTSVPGVVFYEMPIVAIPVTVSLQVAAAEKNVHDLWSNIVFSRTIGFEVAGVEIPPVDSMPLESFPSELVYLASSYLKSFA